MLEIWDERTGDLLADGMEDLLAATRHSVQASGDDVKGMCLEWTIRDAEGRVVAGHCGAPVPWPE